MDAMNKQMVTALKPLKGRAFDIKFAQLMMDHHQMALDMAQIAELWRHGSVIRSWLLDLTAEVLKALLGPTCLTA